MGHDACRLAAETVADILSWDRARIEREVDAYRSYLAQQHRLRQPQLLTRQAA